MFIVFWQNSAEMIVRSVLLLLDFVFWIVCNLVLEKVVSIIEHLLQGHEQQDVGVLVRLQLLTVVFHGQHKRQRDTQRLTQLTGLKGSWTKVQKFICNKHSFHVT